MINRIVCPQGHEVAVAPNKFGQTVICPICLTPFLAKLDFALSCHARKDGGKPSNANDDEADDDDVDDRIQEKLPQKKSNPSKAKKSDDKDDVDVRVQAKLPAKKVIAKKSKDDEEDDAPRVKKAASRKEDADDEEDDEKPRRSRAKGEDDDEEQPRRSREDDEEGEDEEDELDEDAELPIEWTRKKRQLATANIGITAYLVSFYIMLVLYIIMVLFTVPWTLFLVIAFFTGNLEVANIIVLIATIIAEVAAVPIYICHIVGWITGLFSPPKAGGRSVCITAIALFLSPIFLLLVWLLFHYAIIERADVSWNFLKLLSFFAFLLIKTAFYCSLIYIGRIAAFVKAADDRKPQALGWLIVGGTILLVICIALVPWVPLLVLYFFVVFTLNVFYFVITSLRDLIQVVSKTRTLVTKYIKE